MSWVWYVVAGLASGIICGMGIGGGAILIPALTIFLGMEQQAAQKINLLYFIPTAAIALRLHIKNGNVEKSGLLKLTIYGVIGAVVGAFIAVNIDGGYLRKGFAVFLLTMAVYEIMKGYKRWTSKDSKRSKTNSV
ncbi:MAG: sulfite exporter TauE/SafE family protein [Defluviitaleaceae bacterium]|nr:sulfite exporter TauE/SafE family protein [Defluviitaleaceae bacterium]